MKSFQISRLQLFEMIDELFADTVVICHHEKLFTIASVNDLPKFNEMPKNNGMLKFLCIICYHIRRNINRLDCIRNESSQRSKVFLHLVESIG